MKTQILLLAAFLTTCACVMLTFNINGPTLKSSLLADKHNAYTTQHAHQSIFVYPGIKEKLRVEKQQQEESLSLKEDLFVDLGEYKITAYCPCKQCCGQYSYEVTGVKNKTSSGTFPKAKHTIAADINILPYGSKILIDGEEYVVEDTGSLVKGKHIDVYFDNHTAALNSGFGGYKNIYLIS